MSTINAYDVIYHYEIGGKSSGQHDHIQVAATANDQNTIVTAIKNNAQYRPGPGTLVIDQIKNIGSGSFQQ